MEDCDRRHPSRIWLRQFRPPYFAKSNEEVLRPFYDALEACPSDTKLHCAIRIGLDGDQLELSGVDKSAQGQSYWEHCKVTPSDEAHGSGARQPMVYRPVNPSPSISIRGFSRDEWASIVNALTKRPVLEELEIEVFRNIHWMIIEDLLSRVSAVRVLGLRIYERWVSTAFAAQVGKSIRKMKALESLVLIQHRWQVQGMDQILMEQLFPSVSQTDDQSMLNELLWIYGRQDSAANHLWKWKTSIFQTAPKA